MLIGLIWCKWLNRWHDKYWIFIKYLIPHWLTVCKIRKNCPTPHRWQSFKLHRRLLNKKKSIFSHLYICIFKILITILYYYLMIHNGTRIGRIDSDFFWFLFLVMSYFKNKNIIRENPPNPSNPCANTHQQLSEIV